MASDYSLAINVKQCGKTISKQISISLLWPSGRNSEGMYINYFLIIRI